MEKAGDIFKQTREETNLSFDEVEKKTKIPKNFLIAIEENDYSKLPTGLYPHLYVKKYASFLGLSEERMLAIFRRDYQETKEIKKKTSFSHLDRVGRWQKLVGGGMIVVIFAGYLLYQYFSFVRPPKVDVKVEKVGEKITLSGKTDSRATLKIDGKIINLDEKGEFVYQVEGKDKKEAVIVVESSSGKSREIIKKLD